VFRSLGGSESGDLWVKKQHILQTRTNNPRSCGICCTDQDPTQNKDWSVLTRKTVMMSVCDKQLAASKQQAAGMFGQWTTFKGAKILCLGPGSTGAFSWEPLPLGAWVRIYGWDYGFTYAALGRRCLLGAGQCSWTEGRRGHRQRRCGGQRRWWATKAWRVGWWAPGVVWSAGGERLGSGDPRLPHVTGDGCRRGLCHRQDLS